MIVAAVLAAGGGTRYAGETHKLVAPFRGRRVVDWAVDAPLSAGLETILVVGAVELDVTGVNEVVRNEHWEEGMATSLQAAVAAADRRGASGVAVGLGDQPLVPTTAWRAVADASVGPIVVATYGGKRRNPVRLDRAVWPLLPRTGDEGARVLIRGRPDLVHELACEGEPADVDTVEDLQRWS